jgi:hypothetical protein
MEPYKSALRKEASMSGPRSGPNNSGRLAQEDTDELYGAPTEEDENEQPEEEDEDE